MALSVKTPPTPSAGKIMKENRKATTRQAFTLQEVAEREQVSEATIRRMCQRGEIPAYKVRRRWRIRPDYRERLERRGRGRAA